MNEDGGFSGLDPGTMPLSDRDFRRLADIAHAEAGLMIPDTKRLMVQSRLARHLREQRIADTAAFFEEIERPDAVGARQRLISVLTTNVSSFFRERHHFDFVEQTLVPQLMAKAERGGRVRFWSAGCSSGQEPYSLAMLLLRKWPDVVKRDVRILATDIDRRILDRARKAVYSSAEIASLPAEYRSRMTAVAGGDVTIDATVRSLVSFRELNLLRPWPMKGEFDAIFCRNVVIYFDQQTQLALWPRFRSALTDGGHLFLGHSERLAPSENAYFQGCGVTTYRKLSSGGSDPRKKES